MVSVVFPAAGQAHRMNAGLNKVFLTLAGKPMLLRTLLTFSKVSEVGELIVAVGADEVDAVKGLLSRVKGLAPWLRAAVFDPQRTCRCLGGGGHCTCARCGASADPP